MTKNIAEQVNTARNNPEAVPIGDGKPIYDQIEDHARSTGKDGIKGLLWASDGVVYCVKDVYETNYQAPVKVSKRGLRSIHIDNSKVFGGPVKFKKTTTEYKTESMTLFEVEGYDQDGELISAQTFDEETLKQKINSLKDNKSSDTPEFRFIDIPDEEKDIQNIPINLRSDGKAVLEQVFSNQEAHGFEGLEGLTYLRDGNTHRIIEDRARTWKDGNGFVRTLREFVLERVRPDGKTIDRLTLRPEELAKMLDSQFKHDSQRLADMHWEVDKNGVRIPEDQHGSRGYTDEDEAWSDWDVFGEPDTLSPSYSTFSETLLRPPHEFQAPESKTIIRDLLDAESISPKKLKKRAEKLRQEDPSLFEIRDELRAISKQIGYGKLKDTSLEIRDSFLEDLSRLKMDDIKSDHGIGWALKSLASQRIRLKKGESGYNYNFLASEESFNAAIRTAIDERLGAAFIRRTLMPEEERIKIIDETEEGKYEEVIKSAVTTSIDNSQVMFLQRFIKGEVKDLLDQLDLSDPQPTRDMNIRIGRLLRRAVKS